VPEVDIEVTSGIATITLNAPERRNALTLAMADELVAACDRIDADASIGAVVLQARGQSFCAGADRATLAAAYADPAGDEHYAAIDRIYRAFTRVGEIAAPTIAAVRGHAVGAGLNLALATDLRIVGLDTLLSSGFARIGLHPGGGHFALLGRAGREAAAAIGIFAQDLRGPRAVELGLAWECVAPEQVQARSHEIAATIARDPELARATAHSMRSELGPPPLPWGAGLAIERAPQMRSFRRRASRVESERPRS
jgi:enoyl-CoA hydratase